MSRRLWMISLIIIAVVAGIWYLFTDRDQQRSSLNKEQVQHETGVTVGKTAPVFTLSSLDGKEVQLGNLNKPYVLNFWATWCPPCRDEIPELDQFARKYSGNIQFYAINLQESDVKVAAFFKQNGYNIPVLLDKNGTVAQTFRVTSIPTTIVVDSQGIIRYRKTGGVTLGELEGSIKGL